MPHNFETPEIDFNEIERNARRMRAEAVAAGFAHLRKWMREQLSWVGGRTA